MNSVAVVGAGITGLTAAFYLRRRGLPVVVYEASDRVGGMIQSTTRDGFLTELGPNTIMTNSVAVPRLIRDLDLQSRVLVPSPQASTRYIVRDGRPVRVPGSLPGAIGTGLLSPSAKLRVMLEPFISPGARPDESLADFVRRRLGGEFLDYLIDPFVAGVYAGDPEQLSIHHALPKMAALEQRYGSLIKGAVLGARERRERNAPLASEPRMFSLDAGLGVLTQTLAARLNGAVRLKSPVRNIESTGRGWQVTTPAGTESHRSLLLCSPAHRLPGLDVQPGLSRHLQHFAHVYYPPVARLAFGFRRSQVTHPLDGFGALVPRMEGMNILGVLFSSSMFENRAPRDHVLLTVFAGGARDPQLPLHDAEQVTALALDDVRTLLEITGAPVFTDVVQLDRSIPQYNLGYGAVKQVIDRIEADFPGLFLSGSFRQGISVSDCIGAGADAADKVAAFAASPEVTYA